jgi:CheY-like chemotaxis protein
VRDARHIVVVDDEPNIGASLRLILEGEGYRVTVCDTAAGFQKQQARSRTDLYVLDVRLPDGNGLDLLRWLGDNADPTPAVMISGHGTIRDAVDATRCGAFDFLEKPLARDRVLLVVKNALDRSELQHENQRFRELVGDAPRMIGDSAPFLRAVTEATQVARSDVGVLLTGESGSGKELFAEHIHRQEIAVEIHALGGLVAARRRIVVGAVLVDHMAEQMAPVVLRHRAPDMHPEAPVEQRAFFVAVLFPGDAAHHGEAQPAPNLGHNCFQLGGAMG